MANITSKGKVDRKIEKSTTKNTGVSKEEEKKEKKLSNAQKALPVLIVVCVSLAIILLATLIAFFQLKADEKQSSRTLEAVYASSYFTMVDGINNLQVDSAKFETLANDTAQRKSLKSMEQDCEYVLSGLSILPLEAESCMSATKFFNQINGMCEAFINKLDKGQTLSDEDIALVGKMSYVLGQIKNQFNVNNEMISQGNYKFMDSTVFNEDGMNEFSTSLGSLKSTEINYPTMIFDGPFSASLEEKTIYGLSDKEITQDDALKYLTEKVFLPDDKIKVKYKGETSGDFTTYDYNVEFDGATYDVQITKRDGKLLTLSGYAPESNPVLSKDETIKMAENYAGRVGFENMNAVWYESSGNLAYVNLAPIIDQIIYYPDLVKVKIDLFSQKILGFESKNYCFNHINRGNQKVVISESQALSNIEGDFEIIDTNLAVIPLENESEIITFEIQCDGIDGKYYFYVNALNNNIEQILKVVQQGENNKLI